ncbi:hypothetical protein [Candidatus Phycosocius spiralis]|nr:hypothetical protein [Candidatus Phycosocius spiralis]GIU66133.1 hypothetical protein PsB1_0287 [Candidatus Phycosocius spiralis]
MFLNSRRMLRAAIANSSDESSSVSFELNLRKHGITAQALLRDGEFVVQAGSTARREWAGIGTEASGYA